MGGVGSMGEGVTVDSAGNVYAGEVGPIQGITVRPRLIPSVEGSEEAGRYRFAFLCPKKEPILVGTARQTAVV